MLLVKSVHFIVISSSSTHHGLKWVPLIYTDTRQLVPQAKCKCILVQCDIDIQFPIYVKACWRSDGYYINNLLALNYLACVK